MNTQPEALRLAEQYNHGVCNGAIALGTGCMRCERCADQLAARIAELEAELEAVGAGGVQALSAAPAEQQATKETSGGFHVWRDISTAPKDGSRFVATGHNYGLYSETQHVCIAQWFRGCWMDASDWNETSELKYLTHWTPLPPLPGNAARKQGASHDKT